MKALPSDDEDEGRDEDGRDGFLWRTFFFSLLLCFFCYGFSFSLVFLFPCFLLSFFFGLSPAFSLSLLSSLLFSSPELCIYRGRAWSSLRARLAFG